MKKPAIFLGLTFLLSWPVAFLVFGGGMNLYTTGGLVVAVYFMFTPSISAVITQKLIYRQNLMSLRLSFRPNGWFLMALLLPGTIAMASTAASLFFTGVSFTSDPAESRSFQFFRQNLTQDQVAALTRTAGELPIHPLYCRPSRHRYWLPRLSAKVLLNFAGLKGSALPFADCA